MEAEAGAFLDLSPSPRSVFAIASSPRIFHASFPRTESAVCARARARVSRERRNKRERGTAGVEAAFRFRFLDKSKQRKPVKATVTAEQERERERRKGSRFVLGGFGYVKCAARDSSLDASSERLASALRMLFALFAKAITAR